MRKHELAECEKCPLASEPMVPSYGPEQADVVIVGEMPGYKETKDGIPFRGPAGQLLNAVLDNHKIDRSKVLLTNICLCRPPENRAPSKLEIACCAPRLQAEIKSRNPSSIISLGATASSAIMGSTVKITSFRAGPPKDSPVFPGVKIIPTFHPAACLRNSDTFPHLVTDIGKIGAIAQPFTEPQYAVLDDERTALAGIKELQEKYDTLVIDIETAFDKDTTFEHPNHYHLLCIGISYAPNKAIVVAENALKFGSVRGAMARLLKSKRLVAHNGKFDLNGLRQIIDAELYFDTMLASYCVDERSGTHGLKYLATEILGAPDYSQEMKRFKNYGDAPKDLLYKYNAYDVVCTWALFYYYTERLEREGLRELHDFLVRASNALMKVELEGISVDQNYLKQLSVEKQNLMDDMEKALSRWVENPRSPKQVTESLKNMGAYVTSTDRETLATLIQTTRSPEVAEFCTKMLEYRKEQKLYGTYIKGIEDRLFEGRVFPTFLLHGTTTGRLSCRNPNLQNLPRGSTIRNLFVPAEGNTFVQADYSQVELRVVAALAEDRYLQEVFSDKSRDIHSEVAARLGITRQKAKIIVYGLSYGMEAFYLSKQIESTPQEAEKYLAEFFHVIPGVLRWKKKIQNTIFNEHGDLQTPYGRRRRFWLITDENKKDIRNEGTAFLPQSIASDICLDAYVSLARFFDNSAIHIRIPVHDSILVECPDESVEEVKSIMQEHMMEAGRKFSEFVPFDVDIKTGKRWGDID